MSKKDSNILGNRIRRFRKAKKMTQADLAEKIDKTIEMVCHLENGTASTKLSTLEDIAHALNVELYQFFIPEENLILEQLSPEIMELVLELRDQNPDTLKHLLNLFRAVQK